MLMIEEPTSTSAPEVTLIGTTVTTEAELLQRACWGVAAIRHASERGQNRWLDSSLFVARRVIDGLLSVQASVRCIEPGETRPTIESFGFDVAPEAPALRSAIYEELLAGCPNDDLIQKCIQRSNSRSFAGRRRDLFTGQAWNESTLRAWRESLGLGDFSCVVAPIGGSASRVLVLTASSAPGSRELDDCQLVALSSLAREMASIYHERFIRPEERRRDLLGLLSPTQRQIAPLLAEGLKESLIAARFKRSPHTIHEHVREIYRAWGVQTRDELRLLWSGLLPKEWRTGR